ncbi:phospholipase C/P1 nuclease domain-containing protein, partial [Mrakia frigida]|uniref:phospholipase C/P1 nuclease domain-containing protein n=1 Tax=Mrakia frigida TaxID=29902 RepID=UPI003FCBF9F7
ATIAQAHLTPSTLSAISSILPPYADGHLAPIAAWADSIRYAHRETGALHYVNAIGDDPAGKCVFGEEGWVDGERNLLKAVGNYSKRVMEGEGDIPLRFLVHFLGDIHQPLHLAGKLRGGNQAIVKFEGRRASLHSTWDGLLIQKSIRELGNYTTPLPNKRIEAALRGKTYDPFVRFIINEGPSFSLSLSLSPSLPPSLPLARTNANTKNLAFLCPWLEVPKNWVGEFPDEQEREGKVPGCAWKWATEMHGLNCEYVWPTNFTTGMELDTPEYWGRIKGDLIVEKQLAMGGIRLAAVLNSIFDPALMGKMEIDTST